jgi:hypothetical protein
MLKSRVVWRLASLRQDVTLAVSTRNISNSKSLSSSLRIWTSDYCKIPELLHNPETLATHPARNQTKRDSLSHVQFICEYLSSLKYTNPIMWPCGLRRRVCGSTTAGIAGSNPARGTDVCILCLLCIVQVQASTTGWSLFQRSPNKCVQQ